MADAILTATIDNILANWRANCIEYGVLPIAAVALAPDPRGKAMHLLSSEPVDDLFIEQVFRDASRMLAEGRYDHSQPERRN